LSVRLLILNCDLPIFPGRAGHEYLQTTGLARHSERVGLVSLVHTREVDKKKQSLADAGVRLYVWQDPNLWREPVSSAQQPLVRRRLARRMAETVYNFALNWRRYPLDTLVQDFQFRNIAAPLLAALSEERWQALVVVQSTCARWLDYVPTPAVSVLVMHDVRALVYERQAAAARSVRERLALLREARRYRRFEKKYCRLFDLVITVSQADEAWARAHYRPRRLVTVPIPVDAGYFAPMRGVREWPTRILFTGMMSHPPNIDAANFFAREVLPRIQATVPEAEFWIVGREATPEVKRLAVLPGVVVTGFVPDMRPYMAQAAVIVVPLRFGSGMRNKILEAWAMEKCVVSTRVGAEGLDCESGVNILLADGAEALAESVVAAIRDPGLRDRILARGRALVSTAHNPDTLARAYHDAVGSTLRDAARGDEPFRAVIDLRGTRPGLAGGIENFSRSFLDHLFCLDRFNRYTVLVSTEARYDFDTRGRANFAIVAADGPRAYARKAAGSALRLLHERLGGQYWHSSETEMLRGARRYGAEVALSVSGRIHPDVAPLNNVLIMPDIQHEYSQELFGSKALEERRLSRESAKWASHICAISEFGRRTVIERLGIPAERVTTTHLAADPVFHPDSPHRHSFRCVLEKHGLKAGEYLLFPGITEPHRNHRVALQALHVLREAYGLEPLLVCTGRPTASKDLLSRIRDERLEEQVRFLGTCPTEDMPSLYEGASALVFPSLFENFGTPLLEAMWCDCPIVCSNTTSLPEIAGNAALVVDSRSPEGLAHAISRVLTDGELRHALIEQGRKQVTRFSWTKFTLEIVRVLHEARQLCYR